MPASHRHLSLTCFLLLLAACLWLLPAFAALPPISTVTLTTSPAARGVVNTAVTLTASAVTAIQPEYKFRAGYQDATGWHWSDIRDYGAATCAWTPTQARTYSLVVYAREHGHTAVYEAYTSISYQVTMPLTAVTITDSPVSLSLLGAPIKMTALPVGGAHVEYKFRAGYQDAAGWHWSELTNYQTTTTYTWTPTEARSYRLTVYAREAGHTAAYDVYNFLTHVVKAPLTAVALSATPAAPRVLNTPITLTAIPTGGGNVEYLFRAGYQDAVGWHWADICDYGATATCTWAATEPHNYTVLVYAREEGRTTPYDVYKTLAYRVTPPPITAVNLTTDLAAPQPATATIQLNASVTGGYAVEYRFRLGYQDAAGWHWSDLQAYSPDASCQWKPEQARLYTLAVWAREVGHTANYDLAKSLFFRVTAPPPLSAVSLSASPQAPQPVNTSVTLTATPIGGWHVEYRFRIGYHEGADWQWSELQPFSTDARCSWTPGEIHNYSLEVTAREVGVTSHQLTATLPFQIMPPPAPSVAPLADAIMLNQGYGANYIRWPAQSPRVIAYLLYRDTNPNAPLAMMNGITAQYLDSATPLPVSGSLLESRACTIAIDPVTGDIVQLAASTTLEDTLDNLNDPAMTLTQTQFGITCRRVPLQPGETCGYQVRSLYKAPTESGYRLVLGDLSMLSTRVSLIAPPQPAMPQNGVLPVDGVFKCERVPGATLYQLQVSSTPNFAPAATVTIAATLENDVYAVAAYDFTDLLNQFKTFQQVYWRMGAKAAGQPNPEAMQDTNQQGWVYSSLQSFTLPSPPPPPPTLYSEITLAGNVNPNYYYFLALNTDSTQMSGPVPVTTGAGFGNGWGTLSGLPPNAPPTPPPFFVEYHNGVFEQFRVNPTTGIAESLGAPHSGQVLAADHTPAATGPILAMEIDTGQLLPDQTIPSVVKLNWITVERIAMQPQDIGINQQYDGFGANGVDYFEVPLAATNSWISGVNPIPQEPAYDTTSLQDIDIIGWRVDVHVL